jgi:electron transfer flavoprotein beta subunit
MPEDGLLDRRSDGVINELDEYAIEEGLRIAKAYGSEVTVLSMGPEKAAESVRKALSVGADKAVHLCDGALVVGHVADVCAGSGPTADRLRPGDSRVGVDGRADGVMAAMLPERLGFPSCLASKVEVDGSIVRISRQAEDGYQMVEGNLPALVGVLEKINEPRYPSSKGIMGAAKKPVTSMSLADAGIDPGKVDQANSATVVAEFADRPPREAGTVVKDEGDGGVRAAEFLAERKFV